MITFLYGQPYDCNEYCKYYKNVENVQYKFIPAVHRTYYDGSISHVTGIVNITAEDYEAMPPRFDGAVASQQLSRSRGVDGPFHRQDQAGNSRRDTRRPGDRPDTLNLYRARNATNRQWRTDGHGDHPFASSPVFLAGDSAIGSPYFQSISLGFECAMFLAGLIAQRDLPLRDMLDRYELHMYKQWLRVYMRSKMIKHNKDLFECVDDRFALLDKLHIY